jgi:hypothetical protein
MVTKMNEDDQDAERLKKTTMELPESLLGQLALRAIEIKKSQKWIVLRSVAAFLTTNVRADDFAKKILFDFSLSKDPEDRVEIPISIEQLKVLHVCIHSTLRKVGENPDDCK